MRPSHAVLALFALAAPALAGDDEIVKEFKRYFKKYKDTPTRVEAVLALEGTESNAVVCQLPTHDHARFVGPGDDCMVARGRLEERWPVLPIERRYRPVADHETAWADPWR